MLYVLAKPAASLNELWPDLPRLMAATHARANLRLDLQATDDELEALVYAVCDPGLTFEQVRDWFRERLRPLQAHF